MNAPNPNPSPEDEKLAEDAYSDGYEFFRNKWIGDHVEMNADLVRHFVPRALSPQTLPAPGEVEAGARNLYLLQGDNTRMAEALRQCREQFAFYACEHYAAGKSEKGDTNTRFALIANKALTAVKPATVAAANDEAFARGVEAAAKVAKNPGFIEARDTEWDAGVNYAKRYIAVAIRLLSQGGGK